MALVAALDNGPIVVLSRPAPGKPLDQVYLEVDAAESESHVGKNTVTSDPVEKGFNTTDSSRPEPDVVTAECIVSNTPLSTTQQTRSVSSGGFTFKTTAAGEVKIGAVDGYAQQAYQKLLKMKAEGQLCSVVTALRTYRSMVIETLSIPRTAKNYDALEFSIGWKEIRVVENKLTTTRVSSDKRVGKKQKQGAKTTEDAEVQESQLAKGDDAAKGKTGIGAATAFVGGALGF